MTARRGTVEERGVADQLCSPFDAECVATARDHEDQTEVRVAQDVAVAVGTTVARAFGQRDRVIVNHVDELPGRVALGGGVAGAVSTGGGQNAKR